MYGSQSRQQDVMETRTVHANHILVPQKLYRVQAQVTYKEISFYFCSLSYRELSISGSDFSLKHSQILTTHYSPMRARFKGSTVFHVEKIGYCTWWPFLALLYWHPVILVKSQQLILRSVTCRWNLQVPIFKCVAVTWLTDGAPG